MSKLSLLAKLKAASSLHGVAALLGYKPSSLAYLLYKFPNDKKYVTFQIPKKGGGAREINAPDPRLKTLQRRLANVLYASTAELDAINKRKSLAHGFKKSHSIVTNAQAHKGRRYVLNLDIENFFPTINFGRVRGFFLKNKDFELNEKVATIVAQIACHNNELPQGSPCSPIISNLVGHLLDVRLARLARTYKCTYSRYADDLTFSTNQKLFPKELAEQVDPESCSWKIGDALESEITRCGFTINEAKTRMQYRMSRQVVTGLVVNQKVNIRSDYYRYARAMCHSLFSTGEYTLPNSIDSGAPEDEDDAKEIKFADLNRLEGVVNHIHYVKDCADPRPDQEKQRKPSATRNLYRKLIFYKYFIRLSLPLIVCEGSTDSVYLRCAIKCLTAYHPLLGEKTTEGFHYNLRFLRYNRSVRQILQLRGGSGDLKFLIIRYKETFDSYYSKNVEHPVIVVIDNDDGANDLFSVIKHHSDSEPSLTSTNSFYYIGKNLYVVKTPELGNSGVSCIEDLFDKQLLNTEISGKKFNPKKKHNAVAEYGKSVFAEQVVKANYAQIDFSKFSELLNRIVSAIDDFKSRNKVL